MTNPAVIARWSLATAGVLSFCAAVTLIFVPGSEDWIHWPWDDELVVVTGFTAMIIIAGLLSPFVLIDDIRRESDEPTSPESVPSTAEPGDELDRLLERRWLVSIPTAHRRRVHTQFRETAVRTLVRTTDCSVDAAREQLDRGTWTDDSVAAAFVRGGEKPDSAVRSIVDRVYFRRRARRTARAIQRLAEPDGDKQ